MVALSLYLDSQDKKRIYYWLNCPGGEVRALCWCTAKCCCDSSARLLLAQLPGWRGALRSLHVAACNNR